MQPDLARRARQVRKGTPSGRIPGSKACDAGIDFGGDVVLAEVVSGTVKVPTRELTDADSFRDDTARLVVGTARQLYAAAANLLLDPSRWAHRSPSRLPGSSRS